MADPTKVIKGGLSAVRNASRAADQALEAKRLALEAANPPIKASEAYGQHEGAYMKPIFYDRMKVDLSQGKKGGPGFSGIQLVDPNYAQAKAAAGVTDQKMATRILNRNKAGVPEGAKVIWTPSVGGLEQHKSNSTMFGEFADIFANQRKNMSNEEIQKLSDRASNAVNNKGELIFPNGIDLGSRNFRQKVTTYDQRGLMADIFAGRGVGGEKGRTVPMEDLLEKNLDPNVASAGTLDLGNRLFRLEGNVIDRPDLHSDYRKILTGEDLGVNYIPVPIRDVYSDWEVQKALDLAAQGKNRPVTLMDYTKNDPTVQLTDALLTKMQKAGQKKGGVVRSEESPEDMARFQKRFAMHKAIGGKVKKMAGGGKVSIFDKPVHMVDGGKIGRGVMGAVNKAKQMADEKLAADAIGKAAESAGMKAPVTASKPLTDVKDYHTSLMDKVRENSINAKKEMDAFNYKYDKGQRVFTEDSAKKNKAPYEVLERYRHGNNIMWEGEPWRSPKIIDPETGRAKRTPYEPGYRVRGEIGEMILPESAIKGNVDMANGGATRMPPKKIEGFEEEKPMDKSVLEKMHQAVKEMPKLPTSPLGSALNLGYEGYKYFSGKDPLADFQKDLNRRLNPRMDTGSVPVEQFEKLEKARGGLAMAEGGDPSKRLSGNILAGASWNSLNKTLGNELTTLTGQPTMNTSVGGATTADTYKQLMDFINGGGSFDPKATVFLQTGGVDFITGVPREEVKNNIEQIISVLDQQGVNVVLTGAPYAASMDDVINNKFDPHIDPIFEEIAAAHPNVALVDSMGDILQDKSLLSDSLHTNETGTRRYNDDVIGALTTLQQRQEQTQGEREAATSIPQEVERITQPAIEQEATQQVADPVKQDFQEAIMQTEPPRAVETETPTNTEETVAPSVPDYSRAYEALGGADVVNGLRDQLLGMGIDEGTIADAFAKYYPNEYQPEFAQEQLKRGGAVYKESPEEIAAFKKRFALHKATGGKINIPHLSLKKPQKFDDGGIASPSDEVNQGAAFGIYQKPKGGEDLRRGGEHFGFMAELLAKMAKDQGKQEVSSLDKPRAATDLLNRGVLANNPLSAVIDMVNMGLVPLDVLGSKLTGRDIKVSSEKPFLGSEYVKDLMNQYGVTSGEERPMMETALSFASPTAMIKGAMKATDTAKKAPELIKKASDAFSSSKMSPLATEAKTATAGKPTGATYATKQEGPFFRVSPTTLDTSKAKTRGVREADELQGQAPLGGGAGSTGSQVPTRLADEEVARIIADPVANEPLNIAKKYTQETQGADFVLPDISESSLVKQSAIGRAQQLAVEGSPEYKTAVFDAYAKQMPDVLEQAGAKNYDDLMEKAYRQLAKETDAQFQALPYNFSYHRAGEGNYNSSKEMAADVHGNKHLYVYQGGDKHDFLNRIDPASGLNENEKFRAVHDLLGHAIYGNQFGPKGEEMAWAVHSQMYSPLARLAMTAETRGQNSMVNYSPLNANLKAELAKYDSMANEARRKGDKALLNEINAAKRQAYAGFEFAPNKAVLLPPEFLSTKYAGGMPDYLQASNRPVKGTETQSVLTHFSNDPNLQMLDPKRYGTGIKGAEAERLRDYAGGVKDRSYFYLGEPGTVAPEAGLGVNRYRGEASSLYDITQDPLNFQKLARESNRTPFTAKVNQGVTYPLQDANDVERLIKEYGYQGMANPKATKPMAIMFKETPVRRQARGGLTLMK
jgi:hypothetical protein